MESKTLLGIKEAAVYLNISPHTLRKWVKTGKIPHYKSLANWSMFAQDELDEFIEKLKAKRPNLIIRK